MSTYLVELKGEAADLEEFPAWFPDGEAHVFVENGRYYLRGHKLDACTSSDQVLEVAEGVLDEMYAVGLLLWPSLHRPEAEAVIEVQSDGQRKRYLFASMHETARTKDRIEVVVNGVPQEHRRPTDGQRLLAACRLGRHVQTAMLIWSDPHKTWPRLYRIVEELEDELHDSVSKAGFCSDNERDRFNHSANSAAVAGKDSRHASGRFAPPKKPMSLQEATSFVGILLQKTLFAVEARGAA